MKENRWLDEKVDGRESMWDGDRHSGVDDW